MDNVAVSSPCEDLDPEGEEVGFDRLAEIMSTRYGGVEADFLMGAACGQAYIVGPVNGPSVIIRRAEENFGWVASCQGATLAAGHTAGLTALLCAIEIAYQWLESGGAVIGL